MRRIFSSLVIVVAAASQLGATDCGQAVRDSSLDLWCNGQLCDWTLVNGSISRVPTWNDGDFGVSLDGSATTIAQLSPVASTDGGCLEFDLIADVALDASVELEIDVNGDGSIEHVEQIPTSHWKPLAFRMPIATRYGGVRFLLKKAGSGRAVLANIGAQITNDCDGLPAITPAPAPNGAPCDDASGCQSGHCGIGYFKNVCEGCDAGSECTGGQICGLAAPTSAVQTFPFACEAPASRLLGERCFANGECQSGICSDIGVCSACDGVQPCAGGEDCAPGYPYPDALGGQRFYAPDVCSPGMHVRGHGEPCATNDDCATSTCIGTLRQQCDDGRACQSDDDCPFGGPDVDYGLQHGPCITVGIQGGSCQ